MLLKAVLVVWMLGFVACDDDFEARAFVSFKEFMVKFNKNYDSSSFNERFQIFKENLKYIESFNAENTHMTLGVNDMSDMSHEEYLEFLQPVSIKDSPITQAPKLSKGLPNSVDWRNQSVVGPVQDMRPCTGPIYPVVGCVQSFCAIASGNFVFYNPTQVVQCAPNACNSTEDQVFSFISQTGLHTQTSQCNANPGQPGCCANAHLCYGSTEIALQTTVAIMGPMVVSIDASQPSFKGYQSGVYYEPACSQTNLTLNLLVVGYGSTPKEQYWIAQNYWGTSWGMSGYIFMSRNQNNNCGIATHQCHPIGVHQCTRN